MIMILALSGKVRHNVKIIKLKGSKEVGRQDQDGEKLSLKFKISEITKKELTS